MKLQLDTTNKTIKIEESVKLTKLIQVVKKMLPNGEWQDFTLITNTQIIGWSSPIYIKEYVPQYSIWQAPWYTPVYPMYSTNNLGTGSGISGGLNMSSSLNSQNNLATGQNSVNASSSTLHELKSGVFNVEV